jgi:dienelactone hydrolase
MKPSLLLCLILIISFKLFAQPAAFAGDWQGKIITFNLRIVFHISQKDGKFIATADSPDQGAKGIPCDQVSVNGDAITISMSAIGGNYIGTLSPDKKTITGKWNQGGGSFDLTLGKEGMPAEKPKPQTPQPPFNYKSEEVEYDNEDKSVHFGATLTYPSSGNNFPAAILISGSGQQDRDASIMGHKPFAVLADRLTKLGFAVLRVDDRGIGKTTGEVKKATSADFAKDVATGIEYLKSRKEIDSNKIGLIGHSEGGLIASVVGASRKDIDFIILLAGPGIKGADLLAEQGEVVLLKSGVAEEVVKAYMPLYKKFIKYSVEETEADSLNKRIMSAYEEWRKTIKPEYIEQLGFGSKAEQNAILENMATEFSYPWMKYFLRSDASVFLSQVSAKVLALNGEKDIQVLPVSNTKAIQTALKKSQSPLYEVKILPGLNHLFQKCDHCSIVEYSSLDETFSETAITEITSWLKKNVLGK